MNDLQKLAELIIVMSNRLERVEKMVEGLIEEQQAATTKRIEKDKENFRARVEEVRKTIL